MKAAPSRKTVLVANNIAGASGRDTLSGIFRYVNEGHPWRLRMLDSPSRIGEALASEDGAEIDGLIIRYPQEPENLAALRSVRIPIVFTNYRGVPEVGSENRTFITLDDGAIGIAAAKFLQALGSFASFAFVTDEHSAERWSLARGEAFSRELSKTGSETRSLRLDPSDEVATFLRTAPRPIALFASWDMVSMSLVELCRKLRLPIPGQVTILGVDNEELICNGVSPTLSSIEPNHAELGYRACKELDRLFRDRPGRRIQISDAVRAILRRESTAIVPPAEHLVLRAREFIRANAGKPISASDVVKALGVSRSLAFLRFREREGTTIGDAIVRARVAHIQKRLQSSHNSVSFVASECGFPDASALSRYFKRATGLSPREWRKKD